MPPSCVLRQRFSFFGSRATLFGFEGREKFQRRQIRPYLAGLSGRREQFRAYSMVSLSLRYVRGNRAAAAW